MSRRAQVNYETKVERGACALYLAPSVSVSEVDMEAGFRWLEKWDVLMPLKSYKLLAEDYGRDCCLPRTLDVIKDGRQMVYDERVLFIRRGSSADQLLVVREAIEDCEGTDCPLPMLRAIWKAKPLLLALPESWVVEERAT